jgi:hypothetical protein
MGTGRALTEDLTSHGWSFVLGWLISAIEQTGAARTVDLRDAVAEAKNLQAADGRGVS